jgi:hypothetical protein
MIRYSRRLIRRISEEQRCIPSAHKGTLLRRTAPYCAMYTAWDSHTDWWLSGRLPKLVPLGRSKHCNTRLQGQDGRSIMICPIFRFPPLLMYISSYVMSPYIPQEIILLLSFVDVRNELSLISEVIFHFQSSIECDIWGYCSCECLDFRLLGSGM